MHMNKTEHKLRWVRTGRQGAKKRVQMEKEQGKVGGTFDSPE